MLPREQVEGFGLSASDLDSAASDADMGFPSQFVRTSDYMTHPVFNSHHSEGSVQIVETEESRQDRIERLARAEYNKRNKDPYRWENPNLPAKQQVRNRAAKNKLRKTIKEMGSEPDFQKRVLWGEAPPPPQVRPHQGGGPHK